MYMYLGELKLIEHLEVDLFNKISGKINSTDSSNGAEGSTTHIVDLIIAQIQTSQKAHTAKSIGIQFSDLIVT